MSEIGTYVTIDGSRFRYWRCLKTNIPYDSEVTAFYAYTSLVKRRVLEIEYEHNDTFSRLRDNLIVRARINKIEAHLDNKTVFEITNKDGGKVYLGWYDGEFSIGLDVWTEYESNKRVPTK